MTPGAVSRRRALRAAGAAGVLALAGCAGDGGDGDDDGGTEPAGDGGSTDREESDAITVGVLQDVTAANGPEFAHQGLAGLLSGLAYKDGQATPEQLGDGPTEPEPAGVMEELVGETIRYTVGDVGAAGDVEFEFLIRDTASDAQTAGVVASTVLVDHDVDVLYGLSSSNGLERVNNTILGQTDVPLFVGQASTSAVTADGERCRDNLFRATANTAMTSRAGALSLAEDFDVDRVAMFGAETSLGRDVLENYGRIFDAEGIEVVVEEFLPVGQTEWAPQLTAAEEAGADVVIYGFTGQTGSFFAEEFVLGGYEMDAFGQAPSRLTFREIGRDVLGFLEQFGEEEITPRIVEALPFGPVACRYFWNQYDNAINDWLVENHTEVYGVYPDLFTSAAFTSASAIVQAFERAGEASSEAILQEVPGMAVDATPKGEGEYVFQEYNNQARSPVTIAQFQPSDAEYWPARLGPSEPTRIVDKDLTTIPADDPNMTCDLP